MLTTKDYYTSPYTTFYIYEPKQRLIFRLPYYPDRIVHHAVMNVLEPILVSTFTANTYSCIKGRGICGQRGAWGAVKSALKDRDNTTYCLKFDIKKFYPSIDHDILKQLVRRKIKDNDLLWLLDEIIDSADGLPIGNYLSQLLANLYLTYFDHWLKEVKRVKYYFRYADDIVILHGDKQYLHGLLAEMRTYLANKLRLEINGNYQVFPVASRGIDFVGYVFRHTHILLRKRIKKNFARMVAKNCNPKSIASYKGWADHCNSYNLIKKLLPVNTFKDLKVEKPPASNFIGDKIAINQIINLPIEVHGYKIGPSQLKGDLLTLQIAHGGARRVVFTTSKGLMETLEQIDKAHFPFTTTIVAKDRYLEFS